MGTDVIRPGHASRTETHRIAYIDGLRAIAVLGVVLYHAAILRPHLQRQGIGNFFAGQGCHGVELFFVLSGFCLAYPTLSNHRAQFNVARYAASRLVRILPPYYAALMLFSLTAATVGVPTGGVTVSSFLHQLFLLDWQTSFINTSFWTLPIEFRWYFLFPLALWTWCKAPRVLYAAIIMLVLLTATRAQNTDAFALPAFLLGIAAAQSYVSPNRLARYALPTFFVCLALTLLVEPTRALYGRISIAWDLTAALFVIAAGVTPTVRQLLSNRALVAVGGASYSIYLVHMPVMQFLELHGVAPAVAACAGIALGFAFFAIAERPFVSSRLRTALTAHLEITIHSLLRRLGLPSLFNTRSTVPDNVPEIFARPLLYTVAGRNNDG